MPHRKDRGHHHADAEQADRGAPATRQRYDRAGDHDSDGGESSPTRQKQRERRHDREVRRKPKDIAVTQCAARCGVAADILLSCDEGLDERRRTQTGDERERRSLLCRRRSGDCHEHDDRAAELPNVEDRRCRDLRHQRGQDQRQNIDPQPDLETEGSADRTGGENNR